MRIKTEGMEIEKRIRRNENEKRRKRRGGRQERREKWGGKKIWGG